MKWVSRKRLGRYSFSYSDYWKAEKFELTDEPMTHGNGCGYENALHLTKREARALHRWLGTVLEGR